MSMVAALDPRAASTGVMKVVKAREAGGSTFGIRKRAGSQERQLQATARGKSDGDGGHACGLYKMA